MKQISGIAVLVQIKSIFHFWGEKKGCQEGSLRRNVYFSKSKNEVRQGSFALAGGYLVYSSIRFCNFLVGCRYPEVFFSILKAYATAFLEC